MAFLDITLSILKTHTTSAAETLHSKLTRGKSCNSWSALRVNANFSRQKGQNRLCYKLDRRPYGNHQQPS